MAHYYIRNLEGTLMFEDREVCYFKIVNRELVDYKELEFVQRLPYELKMFGVSYSNFNDFFKGRVVLDNAQWIGDYLTSLGMDYYDFETIIKKVNGCNFLNDYWVRFEDVGAKTYADIKTQHYPIF